MKFTYKISRVEAIELNVNTVKRAAKEWRYTLEESFDDWRNEGLMDQWLIDGVRKALSL